MTLPQEMTLIEITTPGGPEVLQPRSADVPVAGPGEILIRVHAAGVNRPDALQRAGKYPMKPGMSPIPGLEVAGEVVALGTGVNEYSVGDKVCALRDSLRAFADMIPAIKPKHAIMREAALRGFSTATDLADYLVRRGLPFRDCHEIVGHAVKYGVDTGKDLAEMSLEELRQFSDQIEQDVFAVLTLEGSVNARNHIGGTAPAQVKAAVVRGQALLASR